MLIGPSMRSLEPDILHFWERDAVSFQVVDAPNGQTARGDYPGGIPGAVRPLLRWTTEYDPQVGLGAEQDAMVSTSVR
jgi:lipopolysaccharide transport system ATP-binding protein